MILCFITDRRLYSDDERVALDRLLAAVRAAARAGVDLIQIRERDLDDRTLLAMTQAAVGCVAGTGARVLVNDRVDVGLASRAHGVHLRGDSVPAARVRPFAPAMLLGRSVHSAREASATESEGGCDYLLAGTVFSTPSKSADHPLLELEGLARVCAAVTLPVLAVGGMTIERAGDVLRARAAGLASIRLFADASRVAATVTRLRAVV